MEFKFEIGNEAILSYKRLDYTVWHALGEFIDNSTQAYFNNASKLDKAFRNDDVSGLEVVIVYDHRDGILRIADNSIGMSQSELAKALRVGSTPDFAEGRSRYGMGMKTAACWFGDKWKVTTTKLGDPKEYEVEIDVQAIAKGKKGVKSRVRPSTREQHHTIIEIASLNRAIQGRTKGKVKKFLSSMYRYDIQTEKLRLVFDDEELSWEGHDGKLLTNRKGEEYKKTFSFKVNSKSVKGWVGILKKGSRGEAGFSILHNNRVVMGWPASWRPEEIYGQQSAGGRNDLINQRLVGEIHLDEFEVTHTKDNILWMQDEEEKVGSKLNEKCSDYKKAAQKHRSSNAASPDERGPTERDIEVARDELQSELTSSELIDSIRLREVPAPAAIRATKQNIAKRVRDAEPYLFVTIDKLNVTVYLENLSIQDPYVTIETASKSNEVLIAVNRSHPHFSELDGEDSVFNYFKHCIYDGIAEWKATVKKAKLNPDTIKMIKDDLLRVSLEIEENDDT